MQSLYTHAESIRILEDYIHDYFSDYVYDETRRGEDQVSLLSSRRVVVVVWAAPGFLGTPAGMTTTSAPSSASRKLASPT